MTTRGRNRKRKVAVMRRRRIVSIGVIMVFAVCIFAVINQNNSQVKIKWDQNRQLSHSFIEAIYSNEKYKEELSNDGLLSIIMGYQGQGDMVIYVMTKYMELDMVQLSVEGKTYHGEIGGITYGEEENQRIYRLEFNDIPAGEKLTLKAGSYLNQYTKEFVMAPLESVKGSMATGKNAKMDLSVMWWGEEEQFYLMDIHGKTPWDEDVRYSPLVLEVKDSLGHVHQPTIIGFSGEILAGSLEDGAEIKEIILEQLVGDKVADEEGIISLPIPEDGELVRIDEKINIDDYAIELTGMQRQGSQLTITAQCTEKNNYLLYDYSVVIDGKKPIDHMLTYHQGRVIHQFVFLLEGEEEVQLQLGPEYKLMVNGEWNIKV